jgi:hypothetical protein
MPIFFKNGNYLNTTQEKYEISNYFNDRMWFIMNVFFNKNNTFDLDYIILLSKIWINIKHENCQYNKNITDIINNISNKINDKI